MRMSCFEDRQTIYPMVPQQWKVAATRVQGLEAAGFCESEKRQGNVRMRGRAAGLRWQLSLMPLPHLLVCQWAPTGCGSCFITDLSACAAVHGQTYTLLREGPAAPWRFRPL